MKNLTYFIVAGCMLIFVGPLVASDRVSAGTTAAEFLKMGAGARPAGLAGAFCAVADETSGMYYNPAGLGFSFSPELQTMYSLWLGDVYYGYVGYSQPTLSGTYGLGIQYLSSPATDKLVNGVASGQFVYSDAAANLSYAARLGETTALGLNLRGIQSRIDTSLATAFTGDAGFLYRTIEEGFSFGLSGQNLFGDLAGDELPVTYRAGMAFKASLPQEASDVLFALEAGQEGAGPLYYAAGLEHWGAGTLGLRVGYKYYADEKQRASLDPLAPWRAGLSLRIGSMALDYAYEPFAALGSAHRLSLTWRVFGWKAKWRGVPAQVKADPAIFSPNNDGAKDSVFFMPQVAQIKDIKRWELQIQDIGHTVIKKFSGKDVVPKILSWDGRSGTGEYVGEGKYFYSFTAEGDAHKRGQSGVGEITADLTPPAASLQVSSPAFVPSVSLQATVTFYVSVSDLYGVDQWQLSLLNERKKSVKVFKSTASVPVELIWDGTDDFYGTVVPDGEYEARLSAWDAAGNRTRTSLKVKVNATPKAIEAPEPAKEIEVKQERRGLVVNLSSQVLYAPGKSSLLPEAYASLDEVVNLLQTYSENEVLIEGHSDSTGTRAKNVELSSARAWAVYSYLVKKGVSPARLKPKGYGPDKAIASNKTPWGRTQNRRVEIIILKKE